MKILTNILLIILIHSISYSSEIKWTKVYDDYLAIEERSTTFMGIDSADSLNIMAASYVSGKVLGENNKFFSFQQIMKSTDGGLNWNRVFSDSIISLDVKGDLYLRDIAYPTPDFYIVVGDLYYVDSNFVIKTTNGGKNWKEEYLYKIPDKDPAFGYIDGLQIPSATTAYCIYDEDSIFKYTRDLTGIEEFPGNNERMTINISPNLVREYILISCLNKGLQPLVPEQDIKIFNLLGKCLLSTGEGVGIHPLIPSREGKIRIDVVGLSAGLYFVRVGDWMGPFLKI